MLKGIDHQVVVVNDLEQAAKDYEQLGFTVVPGGRRGVAAFLIQDVTARDERIPRERDHKNGVTGIHKLTIATDEVSMAEGWYQAVLGTEGQAVDEEQFKAKGRRFAIGPHAVELLAPSEPRSPLVHWLRTYGPSPYSAALHSNSAPAPVLDPKLTHGAMIYLTTNV